MNCRPGDLARVISTPETREAGVVDWFFKVTHLSGESENGKPAWAFEGPWRRVPKGHLKGTLFIGIADDILRPIRDPGDDAVDETLQRHEVTA